MNITIINSNINELDKRSSISTITALVCYGTFAAATNTTTAANDVNTTATITTSATNVNNAFTIVASDANTIASDANTFANSAFAVIAGANAASTKNIYLRQ